jgi:UDP-glucose 4-epimerase
MREFGIPKMHFVSSSAIYAIFGEDAISESSGPCKPISNYRSMKLASEARIFAALEPIEVGLVSSASPTSSARLQHGVIFDFVHKLCSDPLRLEVLGDGSQRKGHPHALVD